MNLQLLLEDYTTVIIWEGWWGGKVRKRAGNPYTYNTVSCKAIKFLKMNELKNALEGLKRRLR